MAHCKIIVISEDLALDGLSDYLYTLINNAEINSHAGIIISKIPASDFLSISHPPLEEISSRYYENILQSNNYTSFSKNVSLFSFFSDTIDSFKEPTCMLGTIGNISKNSTDNTSNMGLAVFKHDKLIGELTAQETIFSNLISNNLQSCILTIPNPLYDSESIDIQIRPDKKNKHNVLFINGNPFIKSTINVKAKIISATKNSTFSNNNYYSKENSKLIEDACSNYLEKYILKYLYKTSQEFESDINGFGRYAVKYFPTIQEWNNYNWFHNYSNSVFKVKVNTSLKSGSTFL